MSRQRSAPTGARVFLDFGAAAAIEREALPDGTMRGNSFAALIAPPIREAATVFVNGRRAGTIWAPPYRVDVTELLRAGANDIRIEVYNTAVNQLAEGGRLPDVEAVTRALRAAIPVAGRRQPAADSVRNPGGAAAGQRAIAPRSSAIATGASADRSFVDASTLIRPSYPICRSAAKNGA